MWGLLMKNGYKYYFNQKIKMFLYYSQINFCSCIYLFKSICAILFKKYKFHGKIDGTVFFYSPNRKEHIERFLNIYSICPGNKNLCVLKNGIGLNFKNLYLFFRNITCFKEIRDFGIFGKENPIAKKILFRIIIYLRLIEYQGICCSLKKLNLVKMDNLVVYTDTWLPEYALINEANKRGITTVTCQHGIYPVDITSNSIHVLNYWNIPSKYALVWGKETAKQFHKYSPEAKVVECGDMNLFERKFDIVENTIGIIMDIPANKSYNQSMINIAENVAIKYKMKIWIRIHPTDNALNYNIDPKVSSFKADNENAELFVAHSSTMIFSGIAEGRHVLIYKSDMKFYNFDSGICFSNVNEFEERINRINEVDWKNIVDNFYCCIGNEAKKKYIDFFVENFK